MGVRALYVLHSLPGDRLCPASLMALIDAAPREIARELEAWIERGLVLHEAFPRALARDAFVDRFFYIHPERLADAERVFEVYV